jgi:hypothetical protein
VQLVCLGGLLTFTPPTTPNLSKIQVLPNEKDEPMPKKFLKIMMSLANAKNMNYTISMGRNAQE